MRQYVGMGAEGISATNILANGDIAFDFPTHWNGFRSSTGGGSRLESRSIDDMEQLFSGTWKLTKISLSILFTTRRHDAVAVA